MKLRRDLLISVGSLVALNLMAALGTVALLSRMGPAIEHILQANVASIEVAERMMGIVAAAGGQPVSEAQKARFADALQQAQDNISEPGEQEVVARIRASYEAALGGDTEAIVAAVAALEELMAVNRRAMREEDRKAQRMGTAGAWSAVFIGLLGFVASLLVIRRLRRYIMEPLAELYATLEAAGKGDRFRRCTSFDAPSELKRIFQVVNQMLDQQERQRGHRSDACARMALVYLLEQQPLPAFVVDGRGHLVAANRSGLEQLESDRGERLRQHLARVPSGDSKLLDAVQLGDGESWYCELKHARAVSEAEATAERPA
jgi:nitrogen fixation/metabolism regulation signal transduction histidine kinase